VAQTDLNDAAKLSALKTGDQNAFADIYRAHWKNLYHNALRRLGDEDQAKDIVQDVFVQLWSRRETLEISNLEAWLQTAIRYRVYNAVAHEKVNDTYFQHLAAGDISSPAPDENLHCAELEYRFSRAVDQMPEKRREIYQLRFEQELSTQHIADRLNITQKTVQNQLTKAVHYLKITLGSTFLSIALALL
jgi:RNA polymerase sigma-70 factor (family 1)